MQCGNNVALNAVSAVLLVVVLPFHIQTKLHSKLGPSVARVDNIDMRQIWDNSCSVNEAILLGYWVPGLFDYNQVFLPVLTITFPTTRMSSCKAQADDTAEGQRRDTNKQQSM